MEELIKIREEQNKTVVDARELHEFLETPTRFNDWINYRLTKYGFVVNEDYLAFTEKLVNGGRSKEYALTLDTAKEIAMVENNEKGRQARKYFIEVEKKWKTKSEPKTQEEKWLDSMKELYETVQEQRKQLEAQKPKVDYVDQVLESDKTYTTTTIAKELEMGAKTLNKRLFRMGVQYFHDGHWILYHKYQNRGYTKTKTHTYEGPNGEQKTSITTVWTERGRAFIHWKMKDETQLKIK